MTMTPEFQRKALALVAAAEGITKPPPSVDDVEFDPEALAVEIVSAYGAEREARQANGGAPSALADSEKLSTLLQALSTGLHRETAAMLARISPRTMQSWFTQGHEHPNSAAGKLVEVAEFAEAYAEFTAKGRINEAAKLPQQWTAGAWSLERRNPDRWARRNEDQNVPKVIVQIGVSEGDVSVTLKPSSPAVLSGEDQRR